MRQIILELRRGLAEDLPIVAGAGAVWAVLLMLLAAKGVDGLLIESYRSNLFIYVVALVLLVLGQLAVLLYRARPESPIAFISQLVRSGNWARRLVRGLPILTALVVFVPAFSAMKSSIPLFNSANWDSTWIAADRLIHGGDPWRLLQPVLGYPIVSSALSVVYVAWFFVMYGGSVYFCFLSGNRELRAQYFITYFASWTICGVVLATVFASVGPCFVGPLLGDHRFDEQMVYLRAANEHFPVLTLRGIDFLLAARLESDNGLGAGISAMPSMHVAIAVLFALGVSRASSSKALTLAAFAYVLLIVIATVHLGPHYAVDGYASIVVTYALWVLAGRLAPMVARYPRVERAAVPPPSPEIAPA